MTEATDQQKSVLLAKAAGLKIEYVPIFVMAYAHSGMSPAEIAEEVCPDLYLLENFHFAWLVLNWALAQTEYRQEWIGYMGDALYSSLGDWETVLVLPPADAQRLILDSILSLILESE